MEKSQQSNALETCLELEVNNVKWIYILTDCKSAITAITNTKATYSHQDVINKINLKARNLLSNNIVVQMSQASDIAHVQKE